MASPNHFKYSPQRVASDERHDREAHGDDNIVAGRYHDPKQRKRHRLCAESDEEADQDIGRRLDKGHCAGLCQLFAVSWKVICHPAAPVRMQRAHLELQRASGHRTCLSNPHLRARGYGPATAIQAVHRSACHIQRTAILATGDRNAGAIH